MLLRIIAPCGDVEIAGYGAFKAGATFAPKPADVHTLIGQLENFEPADADARKARKAYLAGEPAVTPADIAPPTENEAQ